MNKNVEYLAFVDAETGKIKQRFEIEIDSCNLEGRRPQLIKKIIAESVKNKWLKPGQLFAFLKKKKIITTMELLSYAYGSEE